MLLRANVGGDGVILGDGTLFFKVTPTPEESIMGNEEQMPRVPLPDELLAIIAQRYGLSLGQALIRSYREAGGLCKSEEYLAFIPFIRWRLRQELRRHFALVAHAAWRTCVCCEAVTRF